MSPNRLTCLWTAALTLAVAGCASTDLSPMTTPKSASSAPTAEAFSGTPLPPGARIKQNKSFIIGGAGHWFGRLTIDIGRDSDTAYRYFLQNYPKNGWTLVSSVRTKSSLLVFTKDDRNLTIEITQGHLFGAGEAVLTVSPPIKSNTNLRPA